MAEPAAAGAGTVADAAQGKEASEQVEVAWAQVGQVAQLLPRFGHTLAVVPSSSGPKVYALGGQGTSGAPLPSRLLVQVLEPSLVSWAPVPLPSDPPDLAHLLARTGHASAVVDTTIVTFGGMVSGRACNDVISFDTATATWDTSPAISGTPPPARCNHSATAVGSSIYVFGGRSAMSEAGKATIVFSDVWILDWAKKAWVKAEARGAPPPALHSHSAVLLPPLQQRILVFGGIYSAPPNPSSSSSSSSSSSTSSSSSLQQNQTQQEQRISADLWLLEVDTPILRPSSSSSASPAPSPKTPGGTTRPVAVAWSKGAVGRPPLPVVICGPSGVGKGTLISKLMAEFPDRCGFSVSHTTRAPRPGEQDGVHYHFSSRPAMEADIAGGKFLEKADVHGNLYGTSVAAVQRVMNAGKMCILDIDVQGAQQVKQSPHITAIFIFIAPPSFQELERRLRGRGTETEEQISKRLRNAQAELERGSDMSLFNHRIVNDDLDTAYSKLKGILGLTPKASTRAQGEVKARHLHACGATVAGHIILHGGLDANAKPASPIQVLRSSALTGGAPGQTWGFAVAPLSPPPLGFWSSMLSSLGLAGLDPEQAQGQPERDGDPARPRSSHQAVSVGPDTILLAGGRLEDGVSATADVVTLTVDSDSS